MATGEGGEYGQSLTCKRRVVATSNSQMVIILEKGGGGYCESVGMYNRKLVATGIMREVVTAEKGERV